MQKLVTIYLDGQSCGAGKTHGAVEEHLADYLGDGWRVISVTEMGGARGGEGFGMNALGWLAVVLEK